MIKLVSADRDAEALILKMARVSSDDSNTDTGLLRYLIRHKHWSPLELAHMTVEINTSRAIAAQLLRHRSFSFQEFSQRYAEPSAVVLYPGRRQAEKNRQSSIDDLDEGVQIWWEETQKEVEDFAFSRYREAISLGIARECARFLLPLGTETRLYMSGSLRSWIHYLELRTAEDTQEEHRQIALDIQAVFKILYPTISEALWG